MATAIFDYRFDYRDIESSVKKAKKTASYLSDYISDMKSILNSCDDLTGSDSNGYVDRATELVQKKIKSARKTKEAYTQLSKDLDRLGELAESKDKAVAKNIEATVNSFVGKRSKLQAVGDFLYAGYVNFLDGISCIPIVGDALAQGIREVGNWLSDVSVSVYNYFKYGDGKYVLNILKSVAGAVVAVAGVVAAAIGVMAATPFLVIVGTIGVIAGCVYATMKFGDMLASVSENSKALRLSKEYKKSTKDKRNWWETGNDQGSLTAARYYGSISGVKDWIDKTDFGGQKINSVLGFAGNVYSFTENTAGIISSVCTITTAVGNAQYVKGADGKWVTYKSGKTVKKDGNFFQNIITTYRESTGVTYQRTEKFQKYSISETTGKKIVVKTDYSKAFKIKFFEGYTGKFTKAGIKLSNAELGLLNTSKVVKNTTGLISNVETIYDWHSGKTSGFSAGVKTFEAYLGIGKNVSFIDTYTSDLTKTKGVISDFIDEDNLKFRSTPSTNAYQAYLDSMSTITGSGGSAGGGVGNNGAAFGFGLSGSVFGGGSGGGRIDSDGAAFGFGLSGGSFGGGSGGGEF